MASKAKRRGSSSGMAAGATLDLREIGRALILAACGTAIVVGLFALFIKAHPFSNEATVTEASIVKSGLPLVAEGR